MTEAKQERSTNYLRQVIVVRKDLMLTQGKLAAMVAHASMSFILKGLIPEGGGEGRFLFDPTPEQARWLTELDIALNTGEAMPNQVSMAKIVVQVADEAELLWVEEAAKAASLECHRVVDSGYTHNEPGTLVCIAVGPDWPDHLKPVTGGLKIYR